MNIDYSQFYRGTTNIPSYGSCAYRKDIVQIDKTVNDLPAYSGMLWRRQGGCVCTGELRQGGAGVCV